MFETLPSHPSQYKNARMNASRFNRFVHAEHLKFRSSMLLPSSTSLWSHAKTPNNPPTPKCPFSLRKTKSTTCTICDSYNMLTLAASQRLQFLNSFCIRQKQTQSKESSAIYPLPHTGAHRHTQQASFTLSDRGNKNKPLLTPRIYRKFYSSNQNHYLLYVANIHKVFHLKSFPSYFFPTTKSLPLLTCDL